MTYFLVFIFLSILSFSELTDLDKKKKYIFYCLGCFLLWIIAAFRYETGGDWTSYTDVFKKIEPLSSVLINKSPYFDDSYMEFGYKILNSLAKSMSGNIQLVFFIIACINIVLLFFALRKYLIFPIAGLIIYYGSLFFTLDMIVIRQAVAVLLFFVSINYIKDRKPWRYLAIIFIAFLFHRSSVLLIPLYFLLNREGTKRFYIIFFFSCLSVYCFQIEWIKEILLTVASKVGGVNALVIENYVTSPVYGVSRVLSVGVFMNIILFSIYISNFNTLAKKKYFFCFFNLFILNLFIYFVCYELVEVANRYRYYFLLSNVILLPLLIESYSVFYKKALTLGFGMVFSFFYARNIFLEQPSAAAYNPYQNYVIHIIFDTKSDGQQRLDKSDEELLKTRERE